MLSRFKEKGLIWPIAVASLLLSSVAIMGAFVMASTSDGGPRIIDSYYEKAVQWDSLSAVKGEVKARNWLPDLVLSQSSALFVIRDSARTRIPFLTGEVILSRPHLGTETPPLPLAFVQADSSYVFYPIDLTPGLWDFTFLLKAPNQALEVTIRKDVKVNVAN
jgi:nitrogen fixation protein FixH